MIQLLKSYQKKLTNLTANNRSLVLLKPSAELDIDFHAFDFSYPTVSSFSLLELLISDKKNIAICEFTDARDEKTVLLSKKIAKIKRKEHFIFEERGSKDLAVGYPFVRGKLADGTIIRAPLVVFPVDLELVATKTGMQWVLNQQKDNKPYLNKSFLVAYSHFTKVFFENDFYETTFEDSFSDALTFRNFIYNLLKDSKLDINFNRELFIDKLDFFKEFKRSDFEIEYQKGELKLFSEAVMGIFPERGSVLSADYDEIINQNEFEDLTAFFATKFSKTKIIKEENLLAAFPIDASQERALIQIKSGKSIVVQGPPGTGKSQLICNLITDFIANNKKVLVVSQKKAALDVVFNRLKTKQLNPFVGLVHDFRADKKNLYQQLANQIEAIDEYQQINNSLDSIWLEKEFLLASRNIDLIVEKLEQLKNALFDSQLFEISIKEMYLNCKELELFSFDNQAKLFNNNTLSNFLLKVEKLLPYAQIIENKDFLLKNRVDFKQFTIADQKKMLSYLDEMLYNNLSIFVENTLLRQKLSFLDLVKRQDKIRTLSLIQEKIIDKKFYQIFKTIFEKNNETDIRKYIDKYEKVVKNEDFGFEIRYEEIDFAVETIGKTIVSFSTLLQKIKWFLFSKSKQYVTKIAQKYEIELNIKDLSFVKCKLENRKKTYLQLSKIYSLAGIEYDDKQFNKDVVEVFMKKLKSAIDIKIECSELNLFNQNFPLDGQNFDRLISEIIQKSDNANRFYEAYSNYFLQAHISESIYNHDYSKKLKVEIDGSFSYLVQYDIQISELTKLEREVFEILKPSLLKPNILSQIRDSFYVLWIAILEDKSPILRSVSTFEIVQLEKELQNFISKKQEISTQILLLKLREISYKNLEINRLNNRVTYRDLFHQTTKKKKIWAIRKLLETHFDEIMKLVPCWLCSPETVSSVFPLYTQFDLVIFDEASQCFAEKGLPIMFRGKQVCVVGDDKQLPPNDLYQPRFENDSEDLPDFEIDSLLNLSEKYIPQTMLLHHYRSQFEELIAFSNATFYKNKLKFIPENIDNPRLEKPIEYIKTRGVWSNNCNLTEAEEVVKIVFESFLHTPTKSIGVVTFNSKQQDLIEDLIWKKAIDANIILPQAFFVKNIENVQGDERDIIVFSIAYAPDSYGKMQAQFGSLNQQGGENRLNVAVTRAREKMYIVASIVPQQLVVENALNEGPKLFKKFLEYAYFHQHNSISVIESSGHAESLAQLLIKNDQSFSPTKHLFSDVQKGENLVLTDDNQFFTALSIKDFFAYKPLELKSKNWNFERQFSRNFWLSKLL